MTFLNDVFSGLKYSSLNPATTSTTKKHALILTERRLRETNRESLAFSPKYLAKLQTQQCTVELITPHIMASTKLSYLIN